MSSCSRRSFLRTAGLAGAAAVAGLPAKAAWPAPGAPGDALRLVFFTDVHACTDLNAPIATARAAAAINATHPELVIAGGDLIYDGLEVGAAASEPQWKAYMAMHRAIRAPVEPVLGNHDLVGVRPAAGGDAATDPREMFRAMLGVERTWRSFDAGGYRFFLLDSVEVSHDELMYHGGISAPQLTWLASELGRTEPDSPLIVVSHLPLLSAVHQAIKGAASSVPANWMVINNREVLDLFAGHNLLLVLQGHLHVEEMLRWRGTTFITGGAVCGDKWRGPKYGTAEGFGVVTLRPDRVDWEYRSYGWEAGKA